MKPINMYSYKALIIIILKEMIAVWGGVFTLIWVLQNVYISVIFWDRVSLMQKTDRFIYSFSKFLLTTYSMPAGEQKRILPLTQLTF
jgi:hypothetical protein